MAAEHCANSYRAVGDDRREGGTMYYLGTGERAASREDGDGSKKVMNVEPIHSSIVQAICKIQCTLEAVKKSHKNQHGGYMFAGIDDIYAALTRKMGEVGLVVFCLEDEKPEIVRVEKDGKTSQWARFAFSFVLATSDGTWADPRSRRSLYIQVTGAQTFGAAQSYAEKVYLKSLFKIPATTGEMELDSLPQEDDIEPPPPRQSSYRAKKNDTGKQFNELRALITTCPGIDALLELKEAQADFIATLPSRWAEIIEGDFETQAIKIRENGQC